ncbi:ribosomal protein S12 methylthiotransferase accessory factor [Catenuloplanes nepalensis]|uniref:Ribosomal protein S12 methylthiotransferase accessory factor n=1 Tax=Catenuloplanes nepalensis TaxID=587533 RepID=A0ABT9MNL1_9ACTN|nr:YcaO-like family protein [Catenuloplanes nepalensis]MDP9793042.1 ribosomal protein S12 methylthiotransferase accessory factor [Catenuloplanes nepalensis]
MSKTDLAAGAMVQDGERALSLPEAHRRGMAAAAELDLRVDCTAVLDGDPAVWTATLWRGDDPVPSGLGLGKGPSAAARVGAIFEALEHHLSGLRGLADGGPALRPAGEISRDPALRRDVALGLLGELPDGPMGCLPFRAVTSGAEVGVPLFLSVPDYLDEAAGPLRESLGDHYDYAGVSRYSCNNGWAAGTDPVEAAVHALNETIERDALSLLLIDQFLGRRPSPLVLIEASTLPDDLAALVSVAETILGRRPHLIDMTSDLGVPAVLAYLPAPDGAPARIRGAGASLSRHYAIARAVSELVQVHLASSLGTIHSAFAGMAPVRHDWTKPYPALHACYLADLRTRLAGATGVPYQETEAPATTAGHYDRLIDALCRRGFTPLRRDHYVTGNLAVVNVFVPGLERFMLVTDGQVVVPGERGMAVRNHGRAPWVDGEPMPPP